MEELLAYAILLGEGFEVGGLYELFLPPRRIGTSWSCSS